MFESLFTPEILIFTVTVGEKVFLLAVRTGEFIVNWVPVLTPFQAP